MLVLGAKLEVVGFWTKISRLYHAQIYKRNQLNKEIAS